MPQAGGGHAGLTLPSESDDGAYRAPALKRGRIPSLSREVTLQEFRDNGAIAQSCRSVA